MAKELAMLKEWALNYIKNRDVITKIIDSVEENKEGWDIVVNTKLGEKKYYLVSPAIEKFSDLLKKLNDSSITIVVFNTKKNLDELIKNWANVSKFPKLCFIFANPDSELEKKWVVFPHTHDKITEKKSLSKGLKSLFETVDEWRG